MITYQIRVLVGARKEKSTWTQKTGTKFQWLTLFKIVNSPEFDFSCCRNPFGEDGADGPTPFVCYDKSDNLHLFVLGRRSIARHLVVGKHVDAIEGPKTPTLTLREIDSAR